MAKNGNFRIQTPEKGRETAAKTMRLYYVVCPYQSYHCAKFDQGDASVKIFPHEKPTDFGVRDAENFKVPHRLLTLLTPSDKQKACCLYRKNELILFNCMSIRGLLSL